MLTSDLLTLLDMPDIHSPTITYRSPEKLSQNGVRGQCLQEYPRAPSSWYQCWFKR